MDVFKLIKKVRKILPYEVNVYIKSFGGLKGIGITIASSSTSEHFERSTYISEKKIKELPKRDIFIKSICDDYKRNYQYRNVKK